MGKLGHLQLADDGVIAWGQPAVQPGAEKLQGVHQLLPLLWAISFLNTMLQIWSAYSRGEALSVIQFVSIMLMTHPS